MASVSGANVGKACVPIASVLVFLELVVPKASVSLARVLVVSVPVTSLLEQVFQCSKS